MIKGFKKKGLHFGDQFVELMTGVAFFNTLQLPGYS